MKGYKQDKQHILTSLEKDFVYAIKNNNLSLIKKCIDQEVDVNVKVFDPTVLLTYSPGINSFFPHIQTKSQMYSLPLHIALLFKSHDVINFLLEQKDIDVSQLNGEGVTPLLISMYVDDVKTFEKLIKKGANPDQLLSDGSTILHIAAALNKIAIAKILVDYGASVDILDHDGETPLLAAIVHRQKEFALFLIMNTMKKADVNLLKPNGVSPLFIAAQQGMLDLVETLLKTGANPNQSRKSDNLGPLHMAAANGCFNTVKMLVEGGADVRQQDFLERTPMDIAKEVGNLEICRYLSQQSKKNMEFQLKKKTHDEYRTQAETLYQQKSYKLAATFFKEALIIAPKDQKPSLLCNLGHCFFALKNYYYAKASYDEAIKNDSEYLPPYQWRVKANKKLIAVQDLAPILKKQYITEIEQDEKKCQTGVTSRNGI